MTDGRDELLTSGMIADQIRPLVLAAYDEHASSCLKGTPMIPLHRTTLSALYAHIERLAALDGEVTDRAREYPATHQIRSNNLALASPPEQPAEVLGAVECDHYKLVRPSDDDPWTCARCGAIDPLRPKYGQPPTAQPSTPIGPTDEQGDVGLGSGIANRMRWYAQHASDRPLNLELLKADCAEAAAALAQTSAPSPAVLVEALERIAAPMPGQAIAVTKRQEIARTALATWRRG